MNIHTYNVAVLVGKVAWPVGVTQQLQGEVKQVHRRCTVLWSIRPCDSMFRISLQWVAVYVIHSWQMCCKKLHQECSAFQSALCANTPD